MARDQFKRQQLLDETGNGKLVDIYDDSPYVPVCTTHLPKVDNHQA